MMAISEIKFYISLFATILFVSAGLTLLFRELARRTSLFVQKPKSISIDTHTKPIPVGGGLAIFVGMVVALILLRPWSGPELRILLAGGVLVLFGLLDDSKAIAVPFKFLSQFLSVFILLMAPGLGPTIPTPNILPYPMINQIIAVLWIIGIINAINFLDIMDGLAAGTSAIAAFAFFGMAIIHKQGLSYTSLAVALSGAALGFLFFNFNPASIFMGDTGSQFLGLLLGVFALTIPSRSLSLEAIAPALIVLGIPLFEITFTSTIRTLKGKAPWKGSKDHYALRLFKLGYSVRKIVLLTYAVGFGLLLCAAAMLYSSLPWKVITFLSLSLFALGSGVWLSRVKVPSPQKKVQATPLTDPQELVNPKSLSIWAEE